MFNNINLMNHQFMFNGRQDFEKKNSNLNIDIDLVGMGGERFFMFLHLLNNKK